MEGGGGEGRTHAVQRLLHLLPGENLLLLRHVVAVLHRIQGNAHDNQMNAFNLSVCIAPSMLWAPAPTTPEVEGEGTKKVRLHNDNIFSLSLSLSLSLSVSLSLSLSLPPDVSSFQMNDSSYDSLENELNDDPESPFQEQLPLRDKAKPDSRSRDSVITLSDCEAEPDPEAETDLLLQLPPRARPRKFSPAARQPRPHPAGGPPQAPRRLRRSSEPALGLSSTPPSGTVTIHVDKRHLATRKASYDAAMEGEGEEEDEVFLRGLGALQLKEEPADQTDKGGAKIPSGGRRKSKHAPPPPLRLDASCSSLSSPATSPTGSSLSSLDSAFSQYSTDYATNGAFPLTEPTPLSPVLRPQLSPRGSPPQRDAPPEWLQPPRTGPSHGLHPNTWLKRDRRLSLRQPEEEAAAVNGVGKTRPVSNGCSDGVTAATDRSSQRRSSSPPSYQQALLQLQRSRSPFYRGADKPLTVRELRLLHDQACAYRPPLPAKTHTGSEVTQRLAGGESAPPPQGVFYGQNSTTLVLHRQKSHSLTPPAEGDAGRRSLTLPRRASEPTKVTLTSNPAPGHAPDRLRPCRAVRAPPQDGGLRVSDVESGLPVSSSSSEPRFCLSPSATRAVRDYFSSQGQADTDACLRRSQEVALAIVQGKREWQSRRCSDPRVDDFEQLFFAEESYV
uniref:Rho-GAP domain-containing protein n=1 Tax=Myripristis murdjan TaxID=586833 RepID=A0A668AYJ3_9TELE